MSLSIVVCIKPVPASDSVTIDPETKTVRRDASDSVISTLDKNALQLASELKKATDCTVTALTMAPPSAERVMREAMARAADRAVILSDRAFAGGDTFSTSYVLANGIQKLGGCDIILTGASSDDGGTGQMAAQLAEWLGLRHLHNAVDVRLEENSLAVTTLADKQLCQWNCALPALVTVNRGINMPRAASLRSILAASRKELLIWSADDLPELNWDFVGLKHSPTQNGNLYPLDTSRAGEIVYGEAKELAAGILKRIADAGIRV